MIAYLLYNAQGGKSCRIRDVIHNQVNRLFIKFFDELK
jgi:hypothetical protein